MRPPKHPELTRPASAAEVARLAGVSRSAVSRTFTDGASVSERTRAKVMAAAKELNYHVNHLARGISKDASRPVCLLASNLTKPYHGLLLDALTHRLQAAGRMAMVINVTADPRSAGEALERALSYRASASVVMSGTPPEEMVASCIAAGQKVILINRGEARPGVHGVQLDYRSAMEDAVHMLERAGCHRIGMVGSTKGSPSIVARERFFLEAAAARGLEVMVWRAPGTDYEDGLIAARSLLAGRTRPDGVFCITDLVACGFLDAAQEDFALKTPRDLCVIGFDNIPETGWRGYNITTFAQPYDEIAEQVELVLNGEVGAGHNVSLSAIPVWRGSVRLDQDRLQDRA